MTYVYYIFCIYICALVCPYINTAFFLSCFIKISPNKDLKFGKEQRKGGNFIDIRNVKEIELTEVRIWIWMDPSILVAYGL